MADRPIQGGLDERVRGHHPGRRFRTKPEDARRLEQAGADFFRASPFAKLRLNNMGGQDPSYLAHEYYNEHWTPFYHADVARDMGGAKLAYAGSASLLDNFDPLVLTAEQLKLVAEATDPAMRETIKDFLRYRVFRRDVFTRGAPHGNPGELDALLGLARKGVAELVALQRAALAAG